MTKYSDFEAYKAKWGLAGYLIVRQDLVYNNQHIIIKLYKLCNFNERTINRTAEIKSVCTFIKSCEKAKEIWLLESGQFKPDFRFETKEELFSYLLTKKLSGVR